VVSWLTAAAVGAVVLVATAALEPVARVVAAFNAAEVVAVLAAAAALAASRRD
jgi:hypothetical protein